LIHFYKRYNVFEIMRGRTNERYICEKWKDTLFGGK